jgi:serine-type D-Ala-D-Ala carboxypeptidase/endopeptidase
MKKILTYLLICFLWVANISAQELGHGNDTFLSEIETIAKKHFQGTPNHAVLIGIIQNGEKYLIPLGKVEIDARPPDELDIFELGAVSEIFTTTLFAQLEQEGFLSADNEVERFFPKTMRFPQFELQICSDETVAFKRQDETVLLPNFCFSDPNFHPKKILLCDLATHTSALPNLPSSSGFGNKNFPASYSQKKLLKFIEKQSLPYQSGIIYGHSSVGIALLAASMERCMKDDYENLAREKVWHPLGMYATTTKISSYKKEVVLDGHDIKNDIVRYKSSNSLAAAIGVTTSMEDMLFFLRANLNIDYNKVSIALMESQKPRISALINGKWEKIGLGWHSKLEKTSADDQEIQWVSGGNNGFYTYVALLKNDNAGVVILSNSIQSTDDLGQAIVDYLLKMNNAFAKNQAKNQAKISH